MRRTLRLLAPATVLFLAACASDYLMRDAAPAPDENLAVVRIVTTSTTRGSTSRSKFVAEGSVVVVRRGVVCSA